MFKVFAVCIALIIVSVWSQVSVVETNDGLKKYTYDSGVPGPRIGLIGGVHGNEISGAMELQHLVESGYFKQIKHGCVKVIPTANHHGYSLGTRRTLSLKDMNRIYNIPLADKDAVEIIKYFDDCDLVVDFHEGWSWNRINSKSLGSTITPSFLDLIPLAKNVVDTLNTTPIMRTVLAHDIRKQFDVGKDRIVCEIPSTMECYMRRMNRRHLLVEIPGQDSGHPIEIRRDNVRTVVYVVTKKCFSA